MFIHLDVFGKLEEAHAASALTLIQTLSAARFLEHLNGRALALIHFPDGDAAKSLAATRDQLLSSKGFRLRDPLPERPLRVGNTVQMLGQRSVARRQSDGAEVV